MPLCLYFRLILPAPFFQHHSKPDEALPRSLENTPVKPQAVAMPRRQADMAAPRVINVDDDGEEGGGDQGSAAAQAAALVPPQSPGAGSELSFGSGALASSPEAMDIEEENTTAAPAAAAMDADAAPSSATAATDTAKDKAATAQRSPTAAELASAAVKPKRRTAPVLGQGQDSFFASMGSGAAQDLLPPSAGGGDIWSRPLATLGAHRGKTKTTTRNTTKSTSFLNDSSSEDEEFAPPKARARPSAAKVEVKSEPAVAPVAPLAPAPAAPQAVRRLNAPRKLTIKKEEEDAVAAVTASTAAAASNDTERQPQVDRHASKTQNIAPASGAPTAAAAPRQPSTPSPSPAPAGTGRQSAPPSPAAPVPAQQSTAAMDDNDNAGAAPATPVEAKDTRGAQDTPEKQVTPERQATPPSKPHGDSTAGVPAHTTPTPFDTAPTNANVDANNVHAMDATGATDAKEDSGKINVVRDTSILAYRLEGAQDPDDAVHTTPAPTLPQQPAAPVEVVDGITAEDVSRNPEARSRAQASLDAQVASLSHEADRAARTTGEITSDMVADVQRLLYLFGCPYLVAPQEAESQCAELERLGLTQGTVTDDNDVFLFGGRCVYRHVCSRHKKAALYLSDDVEHLMGLSQERLIQLAYLLGCDYVDGIPAVGPVTAIEILAEFKHADNPLAAFREWFASIPDPKKPDASDTPAKARLRKLKRKASLPGGFPNPLVAKTYREPVVGCWVGGRGRAARLEGESGEE